MTIAAASEKADEVAAKLRQEHPQSQRQRGVRLEPMRNLLYGRVTGPLEALLLGAGLVLLICVVNVAALLLLLAHSRQREMALRLALGASRRRIAGALMAESLVLTGLGGLAGIVLAGALTRLAVAAFDLGLPSFTEIALVPEVLAASVGLVLLTGFVTGLVPALRLAGIRPRAVLGSGVRDTAPIESRRQRGVLVAAEVAIAVVLLVGAGLTAKSLHRFVNTDLGYVTENVVSGRLNAKVPPYQMPAVAGSGQSDEAIFGRYERRTQLLEEIATRLAAVPEAGGVAFFGGYMLGEADKDTVAAVVPEPQDPPGGAVGAGGTGHSRATRIQDPAWPRAHARRPARGAARGGGERARGWALLARRGSDRQALPHLVGYRRERRQRHFASRFPSPMDGETIVKVQLNKQTIDKAALRSSDSGDQWIGSVPSGAIEAPPLDKNLCLFSNFCPIGKAPIGLRSIHGGHVLTLVKTINILGSMT